ncbi:hypothetical protein EKO04_009658 [Ascochyta lentis]|uniref:RING-type domain-containing protein n=1 Tax=Ascochyta lentis TaxID=205686 RepID=A0A8H7MEV6_9PLEO|nr:hypothetical protein EKO04_009658 [Ascochyta lentis]
MSGLTSSHTLPQTEAPKTPREQFLASLPLIDIATIPKDETDCLICTQQFCDSDGCDNEAHEEPVCLPCGHFFGSKCVATWLAEKNSCPMCRAQISEQRKSFWF